MLLDFLASDIFSSKKSFQLHNWRNNNCPLTATVTACYCSWHGAQRSGRYLIQCGGTEQLQFGTQVSGSRRWEVLGKCVGGFAEGARFAAGMRTSRRGMLRVRKHALQETL